MEGRQVSDHEYGRCVRPMHSPGAVSRLHNLEKRSQRTKRNGEPTAKTPEELIS